MAANTSSQIIEVNKRGWEPLRPNTRVKHLWSDPATKRRLMMVRMEPGAKSDTHRHLGDELIYVLEGALTDEAGTITAGNMSYRPKGCVHTNTCEYGATILAFLTGDIETVKEVGDAPRSRPIILTDLPWAQARPGMMTKQIWEDPATQRRALLGRLDAGAEIPRHKHIGDELIFVFEGSNIDESGEVTPGNLTYRPEGCIHTVSTKNGGFWLSFTSGHIEPA